MFQEILIKLAKDSPVNYLINNLKKSMVKFEMCPGNEEYRRDLHFDLIMLMIKTEGRKLTADELTKEFEKRKKWLDLMPKEN